MTVMSLTVTSSLSYLIKKSSSLAIEGLEANLNGNNKKPSLPDPILTVFERDLCDYLSWCFVWRDRAFNVSEERKVVGKINVGINNSEIPYVTVRRG